jgi:transcriptional regulator with XRE-family HTH domain
LSESNTITVDSLTRRIGDTVRAERLARGLSLGELAREAGLSKSILARIEGRGGNPSVETLWRVSRALALPLGALLTEPEAPQVKLIPARDGAPLHGEDDMTAWLIHAEGRAHRAEVYDIDLPAGTDHRAEPHLPGTEELIVCLEGQSRVGPLGAEQDLGPGDAVVFAADVAHRYHAIKATRHLCWMLYAVAGERR